MTPDLTSVRCDTKHVSPWWRSPEHRCLRARVDLARARGPDGSSATAYCTMLASLAGPSTVLRRINRGSKIYSGAASKFDIWLCLDPPESTSRMKGRRRTASHCALCIARLVMAAPWRGREWQKEWTYPQVDDGLPLRSRTDAHHAGPKVTPGDPCERRNCPKGAEPVPNN